MNKSEKSCSLEKRRILVVGAGRSDTDTPVSTNGYATCMALAHAGAHVVCADVDRASAQRVVDDIKKIKGQATASQVDVQDISQLQRMVDEARRVMGGIDGLVLNVGISHRKSLSALDEDSWNEVLNINTRAHVFCAKYALPYMNEGGSIVFVSSTASRRPGGCNPAYEASKAALGAVCRAVALAGQPDGVRANVVVLGLIDTLMGRAATQARPDRLTRHLPFGRQGTPWEVASVIRFLLSDEASYVNGIELPVDGGMSSGIALTK